MGQLYDPAPQMTNRRAPGRGNPAAAARIALAGGRHLMASETTPDAPAIPGLTFRRFRGDADYPLMIPVIDASRAADQIHEVETAERLAQGYANTKGFYPTRDVIMAEIDGRLVGYRHAMWWDQLDGVRILHHFGFLRPEWRGQGLER